MGNNSTGADDAAMTYAHALQNSRSRSNPDVIFNYHWFAVDFLLIHWNIEAAEIVGYRIDNAVTGDENIFTNVDPTIAINDRVGAQPAVVAYGDMPAIGTDQRVFQQADPVTQAYTPGIAGIGAHNGLSCDPAVIANTYS